MSNIPVSHIRCLLGYNAALVTLFMGFLCYHLVVNSRPQDVPVQEEKEVNVPQNKAVVSPTSTEMEKQWKKAAIGFRSAAWGLKHYINAKDDDERVKFNLSATFLFDEAEKIMEETKLKELQQENRLMDKGL